MLRQAFTKEKILYVVFGIFTTAVDYITYILCTVVFNIYYLIATSVAWFFAMLFAFATNKKWVFVSNNWSCKVIKRELALFASARILSGALGVFLMYAFVDGLGVNDKLMKLMVGVIIVIINYLASKLYIFHNKGTQ